MGVSSKQEINKQTSKQINSKWLFTSTKKSVEKSSTSTTDEGKMDREVTKTNEENKDLEPVTKTVSKSFMSKVTFQETMEKVEIKIQFVNENILVVKADDEEEKFERKFKLPSNILVEKIESKFDFKEEDTQTLLINIPKDVKSIQVPISIDK